MKIGEGSFTFDWLEHWARIPETESGKANGRTHGVVALPDGDIMVFCQAQPAVLRFSAAGQLKNAWGDRFGGAHGMTLVFDGDVPALWLTDQNSGEVVKTTLDGRVLLSLSRPRLPIYEGSGKFAPTWVAVNEERHGGNGDIWLTDGYGSNMIHRYAKSGAYLSSINGTEGNAGAFACPHAVAFIQRPAGPELYIADRGNRRVQVYDADGRFKKSFGQDFLTSPCAFSQHNGKLYIPELYARLTILDEQDKPIIHLGENAAARQSPEWPNLPSTQIVPGKFNSPHGIAVNRAGDVFITEWILGGRIIKLVAK
jgi:hypothetical protein